MPCNSGANRAKFVDSHDYNVRFCISTADVVSLGLSCVIIAAKQHSFFMHKYSYILNLCDYTSEDAMQKFALS